MRTAFTVGLKDGKQTLITGTDVAADEQKRAFHNTAFDAGKFDEVQYWESGRGLRGSRKLGAKGATKKSGVDFNSAHPVAAQHDKKAAKDLRDLTPKAGKDHGVNWNAAHPVHLQQDTKAAKHLTDLTPSKGDGRQKAGVNWDAVKPVNEDAAPAARKTSKKSRARAGTPSAPSLPPPQDPPADAAEKLEQHTAPQVNRSPDPANEAQQPS